MNFLKSVLRALLITNISILAFTACNSTNNNNNTSTSANNITYTAEMVFDGIADKISFTDTMEIVTDDYSEMLVGIPSSLYTDCILYMGSGATAQELLIFEAADTESVSEIQSLLNTHLDEQIQAFEGYDPEELDTLSKALTLTRDSIVICCVSSDSATADNIITEFFNSGNIN